LPTYTVAPALALAATDNALELDGVAGGLAIGVLVGVLLFLGVPKGVPKGVPSGVPKGVFIGDATFVSIVRWEGGRRILIKTRIIYIYMLGLWLSLWRILWRGLRLIN